MIDFRYHLVSIVAVFLALAIGIVIGSTSVLKGAVLSGLQKTSAAEKSRIDSLYAQNGQLKQQLNAAESFASASEHVLLDGLLDGQRVVLVEAPGASGSVVSGVQNALTTAGATVTGQVQFQTQFFSTGAEASLDTLNRTLTPAGVTLHGGTAQADAGELIASAILAKDSVDHPLTGSAESADQTILNGYASQGYLSTSPRPTDRATLAVVIIPASPPTTSDANVASQTLVTLAQQLNLAGSGTVVAGQMTGSGAGSAIDVMRAGGRGGHMSSVDNADTPNGQIVVAQALYQQLADGTSGSYGSLPGATQPGPSPAPVPSATPSTATASSSRATTTQRPVTGK